MKKFENDLSAFTGIAGYSNFSSGFLAGKTTLIFYLTTKNIQLRPALIHNTNYIIETSNQSFVHWGKILLNL